MELTAKGRDSIATLYLSPTISPEGWVTAWGNRHASWKHGFVVRFLWLGFVVRWGKVRSKRPYHQHRRAIELVIQQADDGDYFLDYLDDVH